MDKPETLKKISAVGYIFLVIFLLVLIFSISTIFIKKPTATEVSNKNIVVMEIKDTLSYKTTMPLVQALRKYAEMPNIRGILFRINSPGGTVGGVQELYREIIEFRKKGKFAVASLGDVAASGGYYVAMACDHVVSNPGSIVGSIGVIMNTFNLSKLAGKYGVERVVIKAGKFKDLLNGFRNIDPAEIRLLQEMVDDSYSQFFEAVKKSRKNLSEAKLKELCDGRVFTGQMAYKNKMVDSIGGFYMALDKLREMARISGKPEILYHKSRETQDIMKYLRQGAGVNLAEKIKMLFTTGDFASPLYYLYMGF